jgi:hypothetical protein
MLLDNRQPRNPQLETLYDRCHSNGGCRLVNSAKCPGADVCTMSACARSRASGRPVRCPQTDRPEMSGNSGKRGLS